jgi:hypothetical protein
VSFVSFRCAAFIGKLQQKQQPILVPLVVYGQTETMPITENASIQIAMSPCGIPNK